MTAQAIPPFIYGTAWKREETAVLVSQAIQHGFTAFDTACQPKHYREDLVGQAIRQAFTEEVFKERSEVYIQTKFSRPKAQDPSNSAYPLHLQLEDQVHASIKTSLHHLRHQDDEASSFIDSLILHSPFPNMADTLQAWQIFESYVDAGRIGALGISNVPFEVLKDLYDRVRVKPKYVQVRFHAETGYEVAMRKYCVEKGIVFQAHKVLKGNKALLEADVVNEVAVNVGVGQAAAFYLCVLGLSDSIHVVNGTKSTDHMKEDLEAIRNFHQWIGTARNKDSWNLHMARFEDLLKEQCTVENDKIETLS